MSVEKNSKNMELISRPTVLRLLFSLTESQGVENQEKPPSVNFCQHEDSLNLGLALCWCFFLIWFPF